MVLEANHPVPGIAELWRSRDPQEWERALHRYWQFVKPANLDLEHRLESLSLSRIAGFDAQEWYAFLHDEYFRWKYTAPNRYATTTRSLRRYVDENRLDELDQIRQELLALDPGEIRRGLELARIHGLGTAGRSGLLSLMYPGTFATVDQFVVKALRDVPELSEAATLAGMNPPRLSVEDAVLLINIMQRRARENNQRFETSTWTARKIDKILWTYGR